MLLAFAIPAAASASQRMIVGFQDDPSFRWREDRAVVLDRAQQAGATLVRTTVYWSRIATTRPANPADPFDPAYSWSDLDEFIQGAQTRGMETMLTIWGTPSWANGGKGQNYAPLNAADLTNFARAVASRYNGTHPGLPFVHYFTIWNESNLGLFLSPQYTSSGAPAAPAVYAKIYRAAYTGIKAGNPKALVGIGETSARGRDKFLHAAGVQETESPGKFAELLSKQKPALPFDAWSHHPYSTTLTQPPTQKVKWPNVTLDNLGRFEGSLDKWFKRRRIPMWVTEYGYQTKPEQPKGVTYAQQAAYLRTAFNVLKNDGRVQMFIWFIMRDDPTSAWQSGLLARDGTPKPAYAVFSSLARLVDARNIVLAMKPGVQNPVLRVPALELAAKDGPNTVVGVDMRVYVNGKLTGFFQPQGTIGIDGFVSVAAPVRTAAKTTYDFTLDINDIHGNKITRRATIFVK
jgi:hypothetical protein